MVIVEIMMFLRTNSSFLMVNHMGRNTGLNRNISVGLGCGNHLFYVLLYVNWKRNGIICWLDFLKRNYFFRFVIITANKTKRIFEVAFLVSEKSISEQI